MQATRIGVDVGGTFTDLVALVDGELLTAKVSTTSLDQADGVMRAIELSGIDPTGVAAFAHGTTVATNALLERRGARVALVTTAGFRDVLEIGRQNRRSLYDLTRGHAPALVPRELRFCVAERMGPDGVIEPLEEAGVQAAIESVRAAKVDAVAVCLLFGFRHPDHERRLGRALRDALPDVHVSLASEVLPEFREFERFATTCADAYLTPRLGGYLQSLAKRARAVGLPEPLVMQSSGGVRRLQAAALHAAACVLSGPAGGVVGAAHVALASGFRDALSFDMGGTSTDVAPILDGRVQLAHGSQVAGTPIRLPMVDVHTVSAGGGSIAWADDGGALRVGPCSAGADPGPAAYGRGGEQPTVTDANVFLGYLADGARLGNAVVLERGAAERCLERLGRELGLDSLQTALGITSVAKAGIARALRVITVERGLDPREFALVAFGGCGGMHACELAEELGVTCVLAPKAAGVLSAFGLAISDLRQDSVRPWHGPLVDAPADRLEAAYAEMEAAGAGDGAGLLAPTFHRQADLRYTRQGYELTVDAGQLAELENNFGAAHERRYGYRADGEPLELVNLRLATTVAVDKPAPPERPDRGAGAASSTREVNFGSGWQTAEILDRSTMGAGAEIAGPCVIEFPGSTCVVREGWGGAIDQSGTLILRKGQHGT